MRFPISLFFFLSLLLPVDGQQKSLVVATYNLENLFDTINHPGIHDDVPTPEQYRLKRTHLARAIGELNPDVLLICEVENAEILEDLIRTEPLSRTPYRFIHYDSRDSRGIDVAMIYRSDRLRVLHSEPIGAPYGYRTRDALRVEAAVDTAAFVFYGVHLPSRRGGRSQSTRMRGMIADELNQRVLAEPPATRVIVLGDFNDNPNSKLIAGRLSALRCATVEPFRSGQGSYAWRDSWLMYDNILITPNVRTAGEAVVFVKPWMLTPEGRFRGYPYRSVCSDHLPVSVRVVF